MRSRKIPRDRIVLATKISPAAGDRRCAFLPTSSSAPARPSNEAPHPPRSSYSPSSGWFPHVSFIAHPTSVVDPLTHAVLSPSLFRQSCNLHSYKYTAAVLLLCLHSHCEQRIAGSLVVEASLLAMADNRAPLLKRVYFEDCPGCRMDQQKELYQGMPYREFFYVWIMTLCTALPISSLFPFLYFMIRDLHVAKRTEDIGFYAGFLGASFMAGRAVSSIFWGVVADRYGRKPVIVIGVISVIIFNTLFGFSATYWMAITTRFLLGSLNGVLGPLKAYAMEICRAEHQALSLSIMSTAWGIGLIIGPAIGGFFAQPADKYPGLFSKDSLFARFPYCLPCLLISLFAVGALIVCYWIPETLHMHNRSKIGNGTVEALETSYGSDLKDNDEETEGRDSEESLFKNWPLISSIIVYCVFSLHDMAYTEIFSLWAVSDKKYGGLSFSSQDVGEVLAISGFGLLLFQLFLYPPFEKLLGPINSSRVASALSIPLLATYPLMTKLSGVALAVVINCASMLKNVLAMIIITGTFILQNNAVPQHQRGAANGLSMTAMSCFKAVAPAGGGAIFSWAQKRQHASFLPGDQLVFFILNAVEITGLLLTFKPFLMPPKHN